MQPQPIKVRPWICLAARSDIGVADNIFNGKVLLQKADQMRQTLVLAIGKYLLVTTFQFNPQGEIVAAHASTPVRCTGMPGASADRHELHDLAITPDKKVRGNFQFMDGTIVRMLGGIKAIGEKTLDAITAELTGRQADGMDYQQSDCFSCGACILIRRRHTADIR
jgi:hypothetical protein